MIKKDFPISVWLCDYFKKESVSENFCTVTMPAEKWIALIRKVQRLESGQTIPFSDVTPIETIQNRTDKNASA